MSRAAGGAGRRRAVDRHAQRVALVEGARAVLGAERLVASAGAGAHRAGAGLGRVLGVRQVVQAVLLARVSSPEAHTLGALVDATHAATMLPLMLDPKRRGFAVSQFWIAIALTVAEVALVGTGRRRR